MSCPSGFVNLPNYITLTRIVSIPVLIWILTSSRFSSTNGERELLASFVFIAASLTDAIDGYLARKRAQVTTMGMLLDPVADKLLIAAAFITLVQFNPRIVPAWMAVIIIGREFLVSGLRSIAASEGFTIQASDLGKRRCLCRSSPWSPPSSIITGPICPGTSSACRCIPLRWRPSGSWWHCR